MRTSILLTVAVALAASFLLSGCHDDDAPPPSAPSVGVNPPPSSTPLRLATETATLRGSIDVTAGTDLTVCGHAITPDQYGSWTATIPIAEAVGCVISLRNGNGVTVWSGEATVGVARR